MNYCTIDIYRKVMHVLNGHDKPKVTFLGTPRIVVPPVGQGYSSFSCHDLGFLAQSLRASAVVNTEINRRLDNAIAER